MTSPLDINDAAGGQRENDLKEDNEASKFLQPYRKLISDHEELQTLRVDKSLRQQQELLSQVQAYQKDVDEIDRKTSERLKNITKNASLIKRILQEKNNSDCIAVGHQHQKQVISAVEGLVDFTNNFPQLMKICQAAKTDGMEIVAPLEDAVRQFDTAVTKGENSMETIVQFNDHIESMAHTAKENKPNV